MSNLSSLYINAANGIDGTNGVNGTLKNVISNNNNGTLNGIAYTGLFANGAILSPFNHDQKLIADTESCEYFISQVLESTAFQNVVQWTLDYAPKSTKRSAETVKKEYKKLMQEYYQVLHSNNK